MRDVRGDVLAHQPVAARRGQHQRAVLVAQRARQPVDLVLGGERDCVTLGQVQITAHPRDELRHLLIGERVVEARHANRMLHFGQRRGGYPMPHLPRRRIRPHQMRERRLQLGIAPDQRIVLGIGNLGSVLGMIQTVVPRDLARQPHQRIGGLGFANLVGVHSATILGSAVNRHAPPSNRIA